MNGTAGIRGFTWRDWVGLVARLVLGIVLVVAGGLKLGNLGESAVAVRGYQILPFAWTAPVGYALPIVEVIVGALLIVGLGTRWAAAAGALLMVAFVIGIASAWARGISIDCGCFGGGGQVTWERAVAQYPVDIARDIGLFWCGLWLVVRPATPWSMDRWLFRPLTLADFGGDDEAAGVPDRDQRTPAR